MANKEKLLALAKFLETGTFEFNMLQWVLEGSAETCGTAACIGGHAELLWGRQPICQDENGEDITGQAAILELTEEEERALFYIGDYSGYETNYDPKLLFQDCLGDADINSEDEPERQDTISYSQITRKGAVTTLRRFAETGKILWFKSEQTE